MQYASEGMMEIEQEVVWAEGANRNYHVFLSLQPGHMVEVLLLSQLDDSLYHAYVTNDTMPESCQPLFENIQELHQFLNKHLEDEEGLSVDDLGGLKLTSHIQAKNNKTIKIDAFINTNKIVDPAEQNRFLLTIVREQIRSNEGKPKPKQPSIVKLPPKAALPKVQLGQIPQPSQLQPMRVSLDQTNPYLGLFKVMGDKLTVAVQPKSKNTALKVYSKESIPDIGCLISVKIVKLKYGAFAIGVVDKDQKRGKYKSPYMTGFAPCQIKCSTDRKVAETEWALDASIPKNWSGCVVSIGVDMQNRVMHLYLDGKVYAYAPISDHLMKRQMVLYIGCMHLGDCFALNTQ